MQLQLVVAGLEPGKNWLFDTVAVDDEEAVLKQHAYILFIYLHATMS